MDWYTICRPPKFDRALWIIGATGTGKSTLAKSMAEESGAKVLECGSFIRSMMSPDATTKELTASSLAILDNDCRYFAKRIGDSLDDLEDDGGQVIVAGCRNPIDFATNFNPKTDSVIFLEAEASKLATDFEEKGIGSIKTILIFLREMGLVKSRQIVTFVADD